jgi:hypothetical protein
MISFFDSRGRGDLVVTGEVRDGGRGTRAVPPVTAALPAPEPLGPAIVSGHGYADVHDRTAP